MIGRFIFDVYAVSRIIIRWVCKKIEKKSTEIYQEKIKNFLADNLCANSSKFEYRDFIGTLEVGETAKTIIRIDRVALSVARRIQCSDGSYIWGSGLAKDLPNTIMKLEYQTTNPIYESGITILTETSKGRTNGIYLEPNYKQDFLYKLNATMMEKANQCQADSP